MHPSNETPDIDDTPSKPKASSPRKRRDRSKKSGLALVVEPERLGICRLPANDRVPAWVHRSAFFSVSRSRDELSVVCEEKLVPKSVRCEVGWRAIKVKGTLDPALIGVLASLANPLTEAKVSIFSISTYDTDYLLVRHKKLQQAKEALVAAGHRFDAEETAAEPEESPPTTEVVTTETPSKLQASDGRAAESRSSGSRSSESRNSESRGSESRSSEGQRRTRRDSLAGRMAADKAAAEDASTDEAPPLAAATEVADGERRTKRRPESRKRRSARGGRSVSKAADKEEESQTESQSEATAPADVSSPQVSEEVSKPAQEPSPKQPSEPSQEDVETGLSPDATIVLRDGSTRRRSVRSQERRERLNRALRKFGAALTSDPRFADASAVGESTDDDAASPKPSQDNGSDSEISDGHTSDGAATVSETAVDDVVVVAQEDVATAEVDGPTDELDLDWEGELQQTADQPSGSEVKSEPEVTQATTPSGDDSQDKAKGSAFEAVNSGAFEGESLSFDRDDDEGEHDDESLIAEGLFTGAIPQGDVEVTDQSFATLGLSDAILEAVREMGFNHPTPIQAAVIPEALEGVDIIGLAETGSGKTAAFVLPLAERLYHGKGIRGLIICPTREIALQTKAFIDSFGKNHKLRAVAIIGGVKMGPQIDRLRAKPDIVVATPGRLADHLRRRNVDLSLLEELVIDEADHMLDLGFLPQIKEILEQVPKERRSMMFSATMLPPIERLAQQFMKDPLMIDIRPVNQVAEGIEHRLYLVHDADLKTCLLGLLDEVQGSTLIFARRKLHTEWLARQLQQAGCPADRIHSDRTQAQRVRALRGFREGKFRILVATDVAARGIDVPRIQHVINYGLPESVEDYVHRAGRTARGNSVGVVSSIGTWQDKATVRQIEAAIGVEMPRCSVEGVEAYTEMRPRRKTVRRRRLL